MQTLLQQRGGLGELGFPRLEQELLRAQYMNLVGKQRQQLLVRLGVAWYRGDGVSGIVSFFCDGTGEACVACRGLLESEALGDRALRKAEKLEELCSTSDSKGIHAAFGKQSVATMTVAELMYKVRMWAR